MIEILIVAGVLLTVLGTVLTVGGWVSSTRSTIFWQKVKAKSLVWLLVALTGISLLFLQSGLMSSRPGHLYYVLNTITGQDYVIVENGYKFVMPGSTIQEWEQYIDIKTILEGEPVEGIEGVISGGIPIRFIDKVTGDLEIAVRMEIPSDPVSFIKLVKEFRHPKNLINNTLIPTIREQVINTAYMFSAEDYVSGDASNFRQTLDDQLKNGGFAVDKIEKIDTVMTDIQVEGSREISDIKSYYVVEKRLDRQGVPIRIDHDIKKNNIVASQVIVQAIELEPKFKKKLETQRDLSAQRGIEIQKITVAQAAQKSIIAEGERDKAKKRAEQEIVAVNTLIAIETRVKEENSNKDLARIALETAKLEAQAITVKADAEAYKNKKLVLAGLSPERRAYWDYRSDSVNAAYISKMATPTIMGGNGTGGGNDSMAQLLQLEVMDRLKKQKAVKK
jgi:hypothetical protein